MAAFIDNTDKVLSGEMDTMDFICDTIESKYNRCLEKDPDALWTFEIQKATWLPIRDARKDGKKLVFFGGPVPVDLIYAFDCQPYYLDQLPLSLAPTVNLASKYIDLCERYANQSMCALSKIELGTLLASQYGVEPDAFVYSTTPCDSSRIAYPNMEKILNKPTFTIDLPFRRDQRGEDYLVKQTKEFIQFMEEFTGKKLDWDKYKYRMEVANKTNELLIKCANQRKHTPCPLPGRLLVANSCMSGQAADPALVDFLQHEYEAGEMMIELGMGACTEEKYRMLFLQNPIWTNIKTFSWLEQNCGAVCIMDVLGHFLGNFYEHMDDEEDCYHVLARKMMDFPMIHGAAGPVDYYLDRIDYLMKDFNINTSIFLGHVGCRHTWASTKILSDHIMEKHGIPTLLIDVDCIDGRYKSPEELQNGIAEYLQNVVKL